MILFLNSSSAYIEVRNDMDDLLKQYKKLLTHFSKQWFINCYNFQPSADDAHAFQNSFDFHVLAIWETVFGVSCVEQHDPYKKEQHIKSRLLLLKQVLQSKTSMQASKHYFKPFE